MDSMREALKRGMNKHIVKGKLVADDAEDPTHKFGKGEEDNDPNKLTEHAPPSADSGDTLDGEPMIAEGLEMNEGESVEVPKELLEKILHALMNTGDHMGRSAMTLNERAKEAMLKKKEAV